MIKVHVEVFILLLLLLLVIDIFWTQEPGWAGLGWLGWAGGRDTRGRDLIDGGWWRGTRGTSVRHVSADRWAHVFYAN